MPDFRSHTLYLVRHGECEHNAAGWAAGHDDSPLTAKGREQARANGRLLAQIADVTALDFHASSLHRTCTTMELLREAAGLPPNGYRADGRLMEGNLGDHARVPVEAFLRHEGYAADPWNYVRPNGESYAMIFARVSRFLETLTRDSVIVTHYGPAWMIHTHTLGIKPGSAAQWRPPHAGIMRLSGGTETFFGE